MARFSISLLAVVFFLALFASAAPMRREEQLQPANKQNGNIPAEAYDAMKSAAEELGQMKGAQANENTQAVPSASNQEDKQANADKGVYAAENALPPTTSTTMDNSHNNKPAQASQALEAASSAASKAQQQAAASPSSKDTHTVNNDPLSKIPLLGGMLSGGGLGGLTGGLLAK